MTMASTMRLTDMRTNHLNPYELIADDDDDDDDDMLLCLECEGENDDDNEFTLDHCNCGMIHCDEGDVRC